MSIFFYEANPTETGKALASALEAKYLRRFDGMHFTIKGRPVAFGKEDRIICWGSHVPAPEGVPTLNGNPKFLDSLSAFLFLRRHSSLRYNSLGVQKMESELQYSALLAQFKLTGEIAGARVPLKDYSPYWQQAIQKHGAILKIHVIGKEIVGFEKWKDLRKADKPIPSPWYTYKPCKEIPQTSKELALRAVAELGLDLGVVSILCYRGENYIRKFITAPVLSEPMRLIYIEKIKQWCNNAEQKPIVQPVVPMLEE